MQKFIIELTAEEVNFMLRPFMKMPFHEVADFILRIQDQIDSQMNYSAVVDGSTGPTGDPKAEPSQEPKDQTKEE
jgi:hypothetical protein